MKLGIFIATLVVSALISMNIIQAQSIKGHWKGELNVQGQKIPLIFKMINEEGKLSGNLDSPTQGLLGLQFDEVILKNNKIIIKMTKLMASYSGKISGSLKSIDGTFTQGGMEFPLKLNKLEKEIEIKRPQTPKEPFGYQTEEITIANFENSEVKLAGTLTLPNDKGLFPLVILVSGSGPQDRDETIMQHKPFWVIADYLTKNGIAVFRYDDRGIAKSKGDFAASTTLDFTSDVISIVEHFSIDKRFSKIGVAGHSEGGLIAPMAATQCEEVDFIIMLAGPGIDGAKILVEQTKLISAASGMPDEDVEIRGNQQQKLVDIALSNKKENVKKTEITTLLKEIMHFDSLPKDVQEKSEVGITAQVSQFLTPWFQFFLKYDPYPTLVEVECPVLALNGDKDIQVPSKVNLAKIKEALVEAENENYKLVELNGLNHLFQNCKTGAISEYAVIEETFDVKTLDLITKWIKDQAGK